MVKKLSGIHKNVTPYTVVSFRSMAAFSREVHSNDGVRPDHLHGLTAPENHRLREIYKDEEQSGGLPSEIRLRSLQKLLDELNNQGDWKHIKLIETEMKRLEEDLASRSSANGSASSNGKNGHAVNGKQLHTKIKLSPEGTIARAFACFRFSTTATPLDPKEVISLVQELNQFPNELGARDALWKLVEAGVDRNIFCAGDKEAVDAVDRALEILGARYSYDGEYFSDITGRTIAAHKIAAMCLKKGFMFDDVYRFDYLAFDLSVYGGQMGNSILLLSLANESPDYEIRTSTVGSFISRIERQKILLGSEEVAMAFLNIVSSKVINHDSKADRLADRNLIKAINIFANQKYTEHARTLLSKARQCNYEL